MPADWKSVGILESFHRDKTFIHVIRVRVRLGSVSWCESVCGSISNQLQQYYIRVS